MVSMSQSIQATTSSRIGEPPGEACHGTPAKRFAPVPTAKERHTASWSAARTLTQNLPISRMCGNVEDFLAGRNATSGGSRETEVNEPTTMPCGVPSGSHAVATATPVGKWPSTSRKYLPEASELASTAFSGVVIVYSVISGQG